MPHELISSEDLSNLSQFIIKKHLYNYKKQKIDLLSVFRLITKKNISNKYFDALDGKEEDIKSIIDEKELFNFILDINPFFKSVSDSKKYNFYLKSYFLSKSIYDNLVVYVESRDVVAFYKIKDITNNKHVFIYDIAECKMQKVDAVFNTKDETMDAIKDYSAAYVALKVPLELEIEGYNSLGEIIENVVKSF